MAEHERVQQFETTVLPHLGAAYSLARWLTGNDQDAEDVAQEALMKAFRFHNGLRGDARPWLLAIVRNTAFTWLRRNRPRELLDLADDAVAEIEDASPGPEQQLIGKRDTARVRASIERLRPEYREVIVLRELEGLSYREIAEVAGVSMGTVMSRLSRARHRLADLLGALPDTEVHHELR